ncbi:uncharacterized protein LOC131687538 [Topomyia yanbarensis]|uniref:uncharacterized protein LOC131687538 n=1 Tax=Topomyia yanbarensis TaxID=2498891 RepID=UPI00273B30F1|nr:uncharacterized protein LOC131687538 [Topomyia yanbarensis]
MRVRLKTVAPKNKKKKKKKQPPIEATMEKMDSYKQFHLDPFNDAADASNLRLEWEEWHRACELVLELSNIDSQHQKLLFMLARGGRGLQRIYYNLAPVAGEIQSGPVKIPLAPKEIPEYDNAIKRLNAFFIGKRNVVELEVFRSLRQSAGESFNRYILKLRTQAARCDFRDRVENELLQQITVGASDERVGDKGLESIMNLDELVNYAVNQEVLQKQKEKSYPFRPEAGVVASVKQDWITKSEPKSSNRGQPFAREKNDIITFVLEPNATVVVRGNTIGIQESVSREIVLATSVAVASTLPESAEEDDMHQRSPVPRKIAYLRIPAAMENKVNRKIQHMFDTDIIEPVHGPAEWISPMVGTDDIRLCINMRYPNQAIHREHYSLPLIDTLLNKLKGAVIFSRLVITSAFHHVELHPDSRGITTFMTSKGLMRFKRLMFGINCAPEIFQCIMCEMLVGIDGVVVYIDDIVVWGKTQKKHNDRLEKVLAVLKENRALLNQEKCLIGVAELEILGFKISGNGICLTDGKIEAIRNFRMPETKEEVRSFLGGDVESFGEEQRRAFDDLRTELTNTVRRLGFFDPKDETELYVDAPSVGLGAVLTQRDSSKPPRIISFASKGLTKTERVYPQTQREALAVVWAVEKFYPYLFGIRFTVFTDHKTLEYIFGGKHQEGKRACSRVEAWALRLQPFDFCVKLCPQTDTPFDEASEHYVCGVGEGPLAITLHEIKQETNRDEVLKDWSLNSYRERTDNQNETKSDSQDDQQEPTEDSTTTSTNKGIRC